MKLYHYLLLIFIALISPLDHQAQTSEEPFTINTESQDLTGFNDLLESKKYPELLQAVQQGLQNTSNEAYLHYLTAQAHMGLKNYQASVEAAAQAVIKDPKTSDYYRLLADTQVLKQLGAEQTSILRLPGLARRTRRNYQTAIALDPNNIKAREGLGLYYLLAPKIVGGSVSKAQAQADEIAKLDMNRAMPFYIGIQKKYRNWDKALELVNEWQMREPKLWQPVEDRFRIYFEQQQYESAAQILLDHLKQEPQQMDANYLLGLVASDSGLFLEQGRDALLKYLNSIPGLNQPGHEWSYYRLAIIHAKLGKSTLAKQYAQEALKASPENTKITALVNDFLRTLS